MSAPHLHVAISSHGYGHGAMTFVVLNRLCELHPEIRISLSTSLPESWIRSRFHWDFSLSPQPHGDFGLRMVNANEVDVPASSLAYNDFHANWEQHVEGQARELDRLKPDLVLSNVSYLPLAAAQKSSLPSIGLGPFTWVDIFESYCANEAGAGTIIDQMMAAYSGVDLFLKPEPALDLIKGPERVLSIGPIGQVGRDRRKDLITAFNLEPDTKIGLIAFGGMEGGISSSDWPEIDGWFWVHGHRLSCTRADMVSFDEFPMDFVDYIASSDVVATKAGYNTYVEAALVGVPVVTLKRNDWPEWSPLINWLNEQVPVSISEAEQVRSRTNLADILEKLTSSRDQSKGGWESEDVLAGTEAAVQEIWNYLGS